MTFPLRVRAHQLDWNEIYEFVFGDDALFYCIALDVPISPIQLAQTDTWLLTQAPGAVLSAVAAAQSLSIRRYTFGSSIADAVTELFRLYGNAAYNSQGATPGHYVSPSRVPVADWAAASPTGKHFVANAPVLATDSNAYPLAIRVVAKGAGLRVRWTLDGTPGSAIAFGSDIFSKTFPSSNAPSQPPGTWPTPRSYEAP